MTPHGDFLIVRRDFLTAQRERAQAEEAKHLAEASRIGGIVAALDHLLGMENASLDPPTEVPDNVTPVPSADDPS